MADINRNALTLSASPDFETLRAELERVLKEIEADKLSVDDLGAELVRLGVAVSLPFAGPVSTLVGLQCLTRQLATAFPDEWETAKAQLTSRGTA